MDNLYTEKEYIAELAAPMKQMTLENCILSISSEETAMVNTLITYIKKLPQTFSLVHHDINSYDSLSSLYFDKTHMALVNLWNPFDRSVKASLKQFLPGIPVSVLHICQYDVGLYIKSGNPKNIQEVNGLFRSDIRLANMKKGSNSRILLDRLLLWNHIPADKINGYALEYESSKDTANAILMDKADVAIGSKPYILSLPGLDFIPLHKSSLDLVFLSKYLLHPAFLAIIEIVRSDEFRYDLETSLGYETPGIGYLFPDGMV